MVNLIAGDAYRIRRNTLAIGRELADSRLVELGTEITYLGIATVRVRLPNGDVGEVDANDLIDFPQDKKG